MTDKQEDAIRKLKDANGQPVALHVSTGTRLVDMGHAVKVPQSGAGKLHAFYRAA